MSQNSIVSRKGNKSQNEKSCWWNHFVPTLPHLLTFTPILVYLGLLCFAISIRPTRTSTALRPVAGRPISGISLKEIARLQDEWVLTQSVSIAGAGESSNL
jgi:hypothetical protein